MSAVTEQNSLWIRRLAPAAPESSRLVCFPHAGGSASFYHPVARSLDPSVEVLSLQYPGRQDRRSERPLEDFRTLADAVSAELRPWSAHRVVFFGHSMGALLAFEVALRHQSMGFPPAALIVSGRRAPSRPRPLPFDPADDSQLISQLQRLSGTDTSLLSDDETREMILPALRGDYTALSSYRYKPGPPLECPILALIGDQDPEVTSEEASAWAEHTVGGFELRTFPGGHFYLTDHSQAVIEAISEYA